MKSNIKLALEGVGAVTAYFAIAGYGAIATYYSGYLNRFGIDIHSIPFSPALTDFVYVSSPIIIAISLLLAFSFITLLLTNWLCKKIGNMHSKKLRWLRTVCRESHMTNKYIGAVLIIMFVFLSFKLVLVESYNRGMSEASNQQIFTVLVTPNQSKKQVIIYQNNNIAITKQFDKSSGIFEKHYQVKSLTNLSDLSVESLRRSP